MTTQSLYDLEISVPIIVLPGTEHAHGREERHSFATAPIKTPPPSLSPEVVAETSQRYIEAYERISGRRLADWYGASR